MAQYAPCAITRRGLVTIETSLLKYTQNFLHSPRLVAQLIAKADIQQGDSVLEIGPGKGIITAELANAVGPSGQVTAVELDTLLAASLQKRFAQIDQIEIVQGDILAFKPDRFAQHYSLFSNIPFAITSQILAQFFGPTAGPARAFLILQTESLVTVNRGGQAASTLKALLIEPWYDIRPIHSFQRSDFKPQPRVNTTLFQFIKRPTPLIKPASAAQYGDFIALCAKDRVGEGIWKKLFSSKQLAALERNRHLIAGRGLKEQSIAGFVAAFDLFQSASPKKQALVKGALARLRAEQQRHEQHNRAGSHHRSRARRPQRKRRS